MAPGVETDLSFSAQLMDEFGIRWRAVPGNHDVGDPRHAHQPVNAERLDAWQRHFGPDRWVEISQKVRSTGILSDST